MESDQAVVVPLLVVVEDEELHRSHFYLRSRETRNRPSDRYLASFKKIRRIQKYMISSGLMRGVPIVKHYDLDATLSEILDHVITRALESAERGVKVAGDQDGLLERAVEAIGRDKEKGATTGETVS
jgi:2-phosphoglycerate kinase